MTDHFDGTIDVDVFPSSQQPPTEQQLRERIANDIVSKAEELRERGIAFTSAHALGVVRFGFKPSPAWTMVVESIHDVRGRGRIVVGKPQGRSPRVFDRVTLANGKEAEVVGTEHRNLMPQWGVGVILRPSLSEVKVGDTIVAK